MSVFNAIKNAIFGGPAEASTAAVQGSIAATPSGATAAPASAKAIDVAAMLDKMQADSPEDFDWRRSIVDLMKLVKLDSSLKARKELAQELGYSGDTGDSATMNVWLHRQVMTKLAEHGGTVPDELKH